MTTSKHLLWGFGLILAIIWSKSALELFQNETTEREALSLLPPSSSTSKEEDHDTSTAAISSLDDGDRQPEQRSPLRQGEFWLLESDVAVLPFDLEFVPPDKSYGKIDSMSWSCGGDDASFKKKLVFVHIVRTEALQVHNLLQSYATSCNAGFLSIAMCSGLSYVSMEETWANRRTKEGKNVRCPVQAALDRAGAPMKSMKYVNASQLATSIDIVSGQIPLGSADLWHASDNKKKLVDAQYIVSLRCPYAWIVSSMIDRLKLQKGSDGLSVDGAIDFVKEKVEAELKEDLYHEIYARYLITPWQIAWIQQEGADLDISNRVDLSLRNLKTSNAVIIIHEKMEESLQKIKYLMDRSGEQSFLFSEAIKQSKQQQDGFVLVNKVLEKLKKNSKFYRKLQEYMKYESQVYTAALDMHERQMKWLRTNHDLNRRGE